MSESTISARGRTTVPRQVREQLGAALATMAGRQPLRTFDKAAAQVDGARLLT